MAMPVAVAAACDCVLRPCDGEKGLTKVFKPFPVRATVLVEDEDVGCPHRVLLGDAGTLELSLLAFFFCVFSSGCESARLSAKWTERAPSKNQSPPPPVWGLVQGSKGMKKSQ